MTISSTSPVSRTAKECNTVSVSLPMSGIEIPIDFDPNEVRRKYAEELAFRGAKRALGKAHRPGANDAVGTDPWTTPTSRNAVSDDHDVVVIGGGFSGLLVAARLKQAGIDDVRIVEHAGDFGGVWYWNRYPGAQCDTEAFLYFPLIEEVGTMPSARYPHAPEIMAHCQAMGRAFGLYEKALFGTAVTSATWDDDSRRWIIATDRGDVLRARFLVRSAGALGSPTFPDIPGIDSFEGRIFHASRWDFDYTGGSTTEPPTKLRDKKVVVVGSGATGVQVVAALGPVVEHLYAVQRTPGPVYGHRDVTPTDPAWFNSLPAGWQRDRISNYNANTSRRPQPENIVDDQWSRIFLTIATASNVVDDLKALPEADQQVALEYADMKLMHDLREYVEAIVQDQETAESLKPWFGFDCKRVTFDDGYLDTFNLPHVTLVDAPQVGIERIDGRLVTAGGKTFEADLIVLATGFDTSTSSERRTGMTITGRGGRTLTDHFADGLRTQHGLLTDGGFPNLITTGQGQGPVAPNFSGVLEVQSRFVAEIVRELFEREAGTVEASTAAVEAWRDEVLSAGAHLREILAQCVPGYYNGYGDVAKSVNGTQIYLPGITAYEELMTQWHADGDYAGLVFD